MARGKPTPFDKVEAVWESFSRTNNAAETAREIKLPYRTVAQIVSARADEFAIYRRLKRVELIDKAFEVQDAVMDRVLKLLPKCNDIGKAGFILVGVMDKLVHAIGMRDTTTDGAESQTTNNTMVVTADEIQRAIANHKAQLKHAGGNGDGSKTSRIAGVSSL